MVSSWIIGVFLLNSVGINWQIIQSIRVFVDRVFVDIRVFVDTFLAFWKCNKNLISGDSEFFSGKNTNIFKRKLEPIQEFLLILLRGFLLTNWALWCNFWAKNANSYNYIYSFSWISWDRVFVDRSRFLLTSGFLLILFQRSEKATKTLMDCIKYTRLRLNSQNVATSDIGLFR